MGDHQESSRLRLDQEKTDALREHRLRVQNIGKSWRLPWTKRTKLRRAAAAYLDRVLGAEIHSLLNSRVLDPNLDVEGTANRAVDLARKNANEPAVDDVAAAHRAMLVDAFRALYSRELIAQQQTLDRLRVPPRENIDSGHARPEESGGPHLIAFDEFDEDREEPGYPPGTEESTTQAESYLGPPHQNIAPPSIPREALQRIERAEKAAKERYDKDKRPYFPTNQEFSFLEDSIFRSISRILSYLQIFANEVLDASFKEYLEYAPASLLTNEALLQSVVENTMRQTETLWFGYTYTLMGEPTRRRARLDLTIADGTIDSFPELEPSRYPPKEVWADFTKRMSEPDSEMARWNVRYEASMRQAIENQTRRYLSLATAKLSERPGDPQPVRNEPGVGAPTTGSDVVAAPQTYPLKWQDIEMRFLSEERVQIIKNGNPETHNYAELGFEDRRNGTASRAWQTLVSLAQNDGAIGLESIRGRERATVEKRVEEIRKKLRRHFPIDQDPVPFTRGIGYKTAFRIVWSRAADT